mmetsp:Transcript_34845/g.109426  ORF Transcript_34845/g.109426 Transcript_34845/m.109426 type:complete len:489 (+) Transcript_34845:111-1577(+)
MPPSPCTHHRQLAPALAEVAVTGFVAAGGHAAVGLRRERVEHAARAAHLLAQQRRRRVHVREQRHEAAVVRGDVVAVLAHRRVVQRRQQHQRRQVPRVRRRERPQARRRRARVRVTRDDNRVGAGAGVGAGVGARARALGGARVGPARARAPVRAYVQPYGRGAQAPPRRHDLEGLGALDLIQQRAELGPDVLERAGAVLAPHRGQDVLQERARQRPHELLQRRVGVAAGAVILSRRPRRRRRRGCGAVAKRLCDDALEVAPPRRQARPVRVRRALEREEQRVQHARADGYPAAAPPRGVVDAAHGLVEQRQRHPVRRVLEPRHVHDKAHVPRRLVTADGREMPRSRLAQRGPVVTRNENAVALNVSRGRRRAHGVSKVRLRRARGVLEARLRAVAARKRGEAVESDALFLYNIERLAAIQHGLVVESPRTLPRLARVHAHGVQHHDQRTQTTVSGLVLRAEVLGDVEKALHVPGVHSRSEQPATFYG